MPPIHRYTQSDILAFLRRVKDRRATVITFDPQYRTVMDKLSYGNEGSRQKGRSELDQMPEVTIWCALVEIERILKPSGYLFLWLDKFFLLENAHRLPTKLQRVDLVTWDKMRMGMGYRTRRRAEYCLILQKLPIKAKATWTRHDIPDVFGEKVTSKAHPHCKPVELQRRLFSATLRSGDLLIDPCAGSFSSYVAAKGLGIRYIGNDIRVVKSGNMRGLHRW